MSDYALRLVLDSAFAKLRFRGALPSRGRGTRPTLSGSRPEPSATADRPALWSGGVLCYEDCHEVA
jgi:hypothetical protein